MNSIIQQTNPLESYLEHKDEIDSAVKKALESGWYILGERVNTFERDFSTWCGTKQSLGVNSGTDALILALKSIGITAGDIVITVSHTAVATIAAIELTGAIPFLVDINLETYTISPDDIENAISIINETESLKGRVKAIIPVHLYGHPCNMTGIMEIANKHNIYVIEDCAQAHGATYNNKKVGTFGDLAEFSFYPTKNLGAFGDGGILALNNSMLYEDAKAIREYGWKSRYISDLQGMNSRLDELQAAILSVKLQYVDADNERRRKIASVYSKLLKNVITPIELQNCTHVYHQYVIRVKDREGLQTYLKDNGIMTAIHYPVPVHAQTAYINRILKTNLENTEKIASEILSLPMYPQLSINDAEYICNKINEYHL